MHSEENLLALAAAARRLRVPARWLKDEAESGRLPGVRTGESWLFHFPTIVALLETRAARGDRAGAEGGGQGHD